MPPFKKGEKITDPEILQRLAAARAKALEVRTANKKAKEDEKLVATMEKKKKELEVQEKLEALNKPLEEVKKTQKEEPEEEEIVVVKKKRKPKKKIVYVNESDDESVEENQVAYSTPSTSAPPVPVDPKKAKFDRIFAASYGRIRT